MNQPRHAATNARLALACAALIGGLLRAGAAPADPVADCLALAQTPGWQGWYKVSGSLKVDRTYPDGGFYKADDYQSYQVGDLMFVNPLTEDYCQSLATASQPPKTAQGVVLPSPLGTIGGEERGGGPDGGYPIGTESGAYYEIGGCSINLSLSPQCRAQADALVRFDFANTVTTNGPQLATSYSNPVLAFTFGATSGYAITHLGAQPSVTAQWTRSQPVPSETTETTETTGVGPQAENASYKAALPTAAAPGLQASPPAYKTAGTLGRDDHRGNTYKYTWQKQWSLKPLEDSVSTCDGKEDQVNQSASAAIPVTGTSHALHYQSSRAEGRAFSPRARRVQAGGRAAALAHGDDLGGWTLSGHHRYDADLRTLYLGDNGRRDATALGAVRATAAGGVLIGAASGAVAHEFAADGRHLSTISALTGATLRSFGYDAQGRLTSVTDADGDTTTIQRDGAGQPTAIVGPHGQVTLLALDANGHLASVTNPAGETVKLQTTATGLLTRYTDAKDQATTFTYDADGRLVREADPAGGFLALARTGIGTKFTVEVDTAEGGEAEYHVTRHSQGGESIWNTVQTGPVPFRFCVNFGGVPFCLDQGIETFMSSDVDRYYPFPYHPFPYLISERLPDGTEAKAEFAEDPRFGLSAGFAHSASTTTPGGRERIVTASRAVALADDANPFSLATLTETTAINGRAARSAYAAATRTFTDTSPAGRKVFSVIDAKGRLTKETVDGLYAAAYAYDAHGRLVKASVGARAVELAYGADGFLQSVKDPLGRVTRFARDANGRVVQASRPDRKAIAFAYDANGNLTALTPPGKTAHAFAYTPVDLPSRYTPPQVGAAPGPTDYTYDLDQRLTGLARPDGKNVDLKYDRAGRPVSLTTARGEYQFAYHVLDSGIPMEAGHLASVSAPGGIGLAYAYDGPLPTQESWTGPIAGSVQYAYDNDFRLQEVKVNGADPIAYAYDKDSLLTTAGALVLARDAKNGLLTGGTLGEVSDQITYNGYGEPTQYQASFLGTPVYTVAYAYDKAGRIAKLTQTLGGVTDQYAYTYDLTGRLTKVARNGATAYAYAYDANGNRLSVTRAGVKTASAYDAQDRLSKRGAAAYAYTANGELQSKTEGGATTTYGYDELGNLVSVGLSGGAKVEYLVDGANRRVGKKLNGALTRGWLYQGQLRPVAELSATGAVATRFVYAGGINVPAYMVKGGATYRILTDHLGSPRLVVNTADGSVAQRLDYDEFGRVLSDTNPGFQPFGYAGGLYDPDTGLVRFGARDYDAEAGRWTAKDPIGFGGGDANLYAYAANNPVTYIDSTGLAVETVWDAANVAMGGASLAANLAMGNVAGAGLDALGLVIDVGATAVPFVPGGAATLINVYRGSKLARNLAHSGTPIKRGVEACHHIVAKTAKGAKNLRDKLKSWDIGVDDAINGVGLSKPFHQALHESRYYRLVGEIAESWKNAPMARKGLQELKDLLKAADNLSF